MKEKLWLHAYSGKEHGLMVAGTPTALRALGEQLVKAAAASESGPMPPGWPPQVARPDVEGPYKDIPDFTLSFHVQGDKPLPEVLPKSRRTIPTPLFLAIAVCAVIGAVVIARWVLAHAL